jgi:hypothetical protein
MTGWKTYLAAAGLAVFAVGGYFAGVHDQAEMVKYLLEAAALAGLRHAITTST